MSANKPNAPDGLTREGLTRMMDQLERYFEVNRQDTVERQQRLRNLEQRQEETLRLVASMGTTASSNAPSRARQDEQRGSGGGPSDNHVGATTSIASSGHVAPHPYNPPTHHQHDHDLLHKHSNQHRSSAAVGVGGQDKGKLAPPILSAASSPSPVATPPPPVTSSSSAGQPAPAQALFHQQQQPQAPTASAATLDAVIGDRLREENGNLQREIGALTQKNEAAHMKINNMAKVLVKTVREREQMEEIVGKLNNELEDAQRRLASLREIVSQRDEAEAELRAVRHILAQRTDDAAVAQADAQRVAATLERHVREERDIRRMQQLEKEAVLTQVGNQLAEVQAQKEAGLVRESELAFACDRAANELERIINHSQDLEKQLEEVKKQLSAERTLRVASQRALELQQVNTSSNMGGSNTAAGDQKPQLSDAAATGTTTATTASDSKKNTATTVGLQQQHNQRLTAIVAAEYAEQIRHLEVKLESSQMANGHLSARVADLETTVSALRKELASTVRENTSQSLSAQMARQRLLAVKQDAVLLSTVLTTTRDDMDAAIAHCQGNETLVKFVDRAAADLSHVSHFLVQLRAIDAVGVPTAFGSAGTNDPLGSPSSDGGVSIPTSRPASEMNLAGGTAVGGGTHAGTVLYERAPAKYGGVAGRRLVAPAASPLRGSTTTANTAAAPTAGGGYQQQPPFSSTSNNNNYSSSYGITTTTTTTTAGGTSVRSGSGGGGVYQPHCVRSGSGGGVYQPHSQPMYPFSYSSADRPSVVLNEVRRVVKSSQLATANPGSSRASSTAPLVSPSAL